jgi:hypothetical protein
MFLDERDKVAGDEPGKRGSTEVGISRKEVPGTCVEIRKIATTSAGYTYFLSDHRIMLKDGDPPSPLPRSEGTEEPCSTGTENENIRGIDF